MHISYRSVISALMLALIIFFCKTVSASLPLTNTIHTIPEEKIDLSFEERVYSSGTVFSKESFSTGIGATSYYSVWLTIDYLHRWSDNNHDGRTGDIFIRNWFFGSNYFDDSLSLGLNIMLRIPAGPDIYRSNEWHALSYGIHEVYAGLVGQLQVERLYIHFDVHYVFSEGRNEDFYGGFRYDPTVKETYISFFGLNPFFDKSFLSLERLKNDYMITSASINTDYFYPFIPNAGMSVSNGLYYGERGNEIYERGPHHVPVNFSFGIRYFFSREYYGGLYCIINVVSSHAEFVSGLDISLQF